MTTSVSRQPFLVARRVPFLPPPPPRCACGEALTLEMERDCGTCVDCQAEAAGVSNGGLA